MVRINYVETDGVMGSVRIKSKNWELLVVPVQNEVELYVVGVFDDDNRPNQDNTNGVRHMFLGNLNKVEDLRHINETCCFWDHGHKDFSDNYVLNESV